MLNLFPYNPGHVLVCPYRHVAVYVDLTDEETAEFTALTKQAIHALDKASAPMGYNLGMNQGAVAGAGVAAHLHQHVVPRWGGDSNFLLIVARTKALPMLLEDVRRGLWRLAGGADGLRTDRLDGTMLNRLLRETWTKVMTPIATLFLRLGISPDVVTIVGTVGVCVGALAFTHGASSSWGTLVVTLFIFSDNVDGVMARMSGRQGPWGAYLDSTLDRVGDAAIFGGLVLYFAGRTRTSSAPGSHWPASSSGSS